MYRRQHIGHAMQCAHAYALRTHRCALRKLMALELAHGRRRLALVLEVHKAHAAHGAEAYEAQLALEQRLDGLEVY